MNVTKRFLEENLSIIKLVWILAAFFALDIAGEFGYLVDSRCVIFKLIYLSGILVFLLQVATVKGWYKKRFFWLGGLICLSYVITILVNYKYNFFANSKNLLWLFLYFGVYYSFDIGQSREKYDKGLFVFNNVFIITNMLCCVGALIFYVMGLGIRLFNKYGDFVLGYHFSHSRLFGITTSVTNAARIAIISLAFSIINSKMRYVSKKWKIVYIANAILTVIFLVPTATRGAMLTFAIFLFMYVFGKQYACSSVAFVKRVAQAFAKGFLISVSWILILLFLRPVLARIPEIGNNFIENNEITIRQNADSSQKVTSIVAVNREINSEAGGVIRDLVDGGSLNEIMDRRTAWWEVFRNNWVFGIGSANEKVYLEKYFGSIKKGTSLQMHTFTNTLVFSGVSGFVLYLILVLCISIWSIKMLLYGEWSVSKELGLIYLALMLALTVHTAFMYSNGIFSLLYWLFAGCAVRFVGDEK